jgi:hypothetical protein
MKIHRRIENFLDDIIPSARRLFLLILGTCITIAMVKLTILFLIDPGTL